jgi:hypothetical protein
MTAQNVVHARADVVKGGWSIDAGKDNPSEDSDCNDDRSHTHRQIVIPRRKAFSLLNIDMVES